MNLVELFRESEEGGVNRPSILTVRGRLPYEEQAPVLRSRGWVVDPFRLEKRRFLSGAASAYGDTERLWREDLTSSVERYRIGLPAAFVAKVRRNAGRFLATDAQLRKAYQEIVDIYAHALTAEAHPRCHWSRSSPELRVDVVISDGLVPGPAYLPAP